MKWASVAARWAAGFRRGARAREQLAEAYRDVFAGRGDRTKAQIVLADLANEAGFHRALGPGFDALDRAWHDGAKASFARIVSFLGMEPAEVEALQTAARREALADSEGTI